jgi:N-acetylmuramoyl-L-alanine amidase
MGRPYGEIAERIYNLLAGTGANVGMFDQLGNSITDARKAIRFNIQTPYEILIRLDTDNETIVIRSGQDIYDTPLWNQLRNLKHQYILNQDYQVIGKSLKAKRDEKMDIARSRASDEENTLAEQKFARMSGTTRTSYQKLDDSVSIVVRHRKPVEEEARGARSRNISAIYIRRGDEQFRLSENSMIAARAMARHLKNGGEVWDEVGTAITETIAQARRLSRFVNYVSRNNMLSEDNEEYVSLARTQISQVKSTLESLSKANSYARAADQLRSIRATPPEQLDEELGNKFDITKRDHRVDDVLGDLHALKTAREEFQRRIEEAISKTNFGRLKNMLRETDIIDFADAKARLGYQVNQLSSTTNDPELSTYLSDIGQKISTGGNLSQHEYTTVKNCLFAASDKKLTESQQSDNSLALSVFKDTGAVALNCLDFAASMLKHTRTVPQEKSGVSNHDDLGDDSYHHRVFGEWALKDMFRLVSAAREIVSELQYKHGITLASVISMINEHDAAGNKYYSKTWRDGFVVDNYILWLSFSVKRDGSIINYEWRTIADPTDTVIPTVLARLPVSKQSSGPKSAPVGASSTTMTTEVAQSFGGSGLKKLAAANRARQAAERAADRNARQAAERARARALSAQQATPTLANSTTISGWAELEFMIADAFGRSWPDLEADDLLLPAMKKKMTRSLPDWDILELVDNTVRANSNHTSRYDIYAEIEQDVMPDYPGVGPFYSSNRRVSESGLSYPDSESGVQALMKDYAHQSIEISSMVPGSDPGEWLVADTKQNQYIVYTSGHPIGPDFEAIDESTQLNEDPGHSILDVISPQQFDNLCQIYAAGEDFTADDDLYEKFYEYYIREMPYGTAKARDGDPYEWFYDRVLHDYGSEIRNRCESLQISGDQGGLVPVEILTSEAWDLLYGEFEHAINYGDNDQLLLPASEIDAIENRMMELGFHSGTDYIVDDSAASQEKFHEAHTAEFTLPNAHESLNEFNLDLTSPKAIMGYINDRAKELGVGIRRLNYSHQSIFLVLENDGTSYNELVTHPLVYDILNYLARSGYKKSSYHLNYPVTSTRVSYTIMLESSYHFDESSPQRSKKKELSESCDLEERLGASIAAAIGAASIAGSAGNILNQPVPSHSHDAATTQQVSSSPASTAVRVSQPAPEKAPGDVTPVVDNDDLRYLALTIWGEARSHGEDGMRAVGHVIVNRLSLSKSSNRAARRYGSGTVENVVRHRRQFSCWNTNDPNKRRMRNIDQLVVNRPDYHAWQDAQRIAREILTNQSVDPTGGAVMYHATYVSPAWSRADSMVQVANVENHVFYKDADVQSV